MTVTENHPAEAHAEPDLRLLPVTAVMTTRVVSVGSGTRVMRAMDTVLVTGLRHLAVVDTMGRCLGVVASEAIAVRLMGHATPPTATMADMLPRAATTVPAWTTVAQAIETMLDGLVDAVCVLDSELYPIGVLTWSDVVGLVPGTSGHRRLQEP